MRIGSIELAKVKSDVKYMVPNSSYMKYNNSYLLLARLSRKLALL